MSKCSAVLGAMAMIGSLTGIMVPAYGQGGYDVLMHDPARQAIMGGSFTVQGKEKHQIVDVKNPKHYTICYIGGAGGGHSATMIYDGKQTELKPGNCHDVEAANIAVQGNHEDSFMQATYKHIPLRGQ